MPFEKLVTAIKGELKNDGEGKRKNTFDRLLANNIVSTEQLFENAAGTMLPLYSFYTKTRKLDPDLVIAFLSKHLVWEAINELEFANRRWVFDHGLTTEVDGQYRYLLNFAGDGVGGIIQDKDTLEISNVELSNDAVRPLSFAHGLLTEDQNRHLQEQLRVADKKKWDEVSSSSLPLSGHSARHTYESSVRYVESGYRNILHAVTRCLFKPVTNDAFTQEARANFGLSQSDIKRIDGKARSIKMAEQRRAFFYGHKVFRSRFADQSAMAVINRVSTPNSVKLHDYLTDARASDRDRINRADFFLTYRVASSVIGSKLFPNTVQHHLGGLNSLLVNEPQQINDEVDKAQSSHPSLTRQQLTSKMISDLIDRDGANVDLKQLLSLTGIVLKTDGQRLNYNTLVQHLKGLTPQRTGVFTIKNYLNCFKSASKEVLPKTRGDWQAYRKLVSLITKDDPLAFNDDASVASVASVSDVKKFWKSVAKADGLNKYMRGLESAGLPISDATDTLAQYLDDGYHVLPMTYTFTEKMANSAAELANRNAFNDYRTAIKVEMKNHKEQMNFKSAVKLSHEMHDIQLVAYDIYALLGCENDSIVSWNAVMEDPVELGGYVLTPILNQVDLQREGREMRHCVSGYVGACLRGESTIITIVNDSDLKDRATLEIKYNETTDEKGKPNGVKLKNVQLRSFNNTNPSKALTLMANRYINKLNRGGKNTFTQYRFMMDSVDHEALANNGGGNAFISTLLYLVAFAKKGITLNKEGLIEFCQRHDVAQDDLLAQFSEQDLSLTLESNKVVNEAIKPAKDAYQGIPLPLAI